MKKILYILFVMALVFSCDIGGDSDKKEDDPVVNQGAGEGGTTTPGTGESVNVDPKVDVSLQVLTVNGLALELVDGESNYEFYLKASGSTGETHFTVDAATTNSLAVITGLGSSSVSNPPVAEVVNFEVKQESRDKLFTFTVTAEDGITTKNYNVRIYSAPAWIKFPLSYGDHDLLNKQATIYIEADPSYEYSTNINLSKPKHFYMPLPNTNSINPWSVRFNIDLDDNGRDYNDLYAGPGNKEINFPSSGIYTFETLNCYHINRVKIPNTTMNVTTDTLVYTKDVITGAFERIWNIEVKPAIDGSITLLNVYKHGNFEIFLKNKEDGQDDPEMYSFGQYDITDLSDIVVREADITTGVVSNYGLSLIGYKLNSPTEGTVTFSEGIDLDVFKSNFIILNSPNSDGTYYDVSYTATLNSTNDVVTITIPALNGKIKYELDRSMRSLTGNKVIDEIELKIN